MADFGAFTGGGGAVNPYAQQSPQNRWAAILNSISQGLSKVAESRIKSEEDDAKEKHEDARDAARTAAAENLARFNQGQETARTNSVIAGESERERKRLEAEAGEHASDRTLRQQEHADEMKLGQQRLGVESAHLQIDQQRANADTKRAEKSDAAAAEKEKHDEESSRKNRAAEALRATQSNISSLQNQKAQIIADQRANPADFISPEAKDAARKQIAEIDAQIGDARKDLGRLSTAAGFEPTSAKNEATGAGAKLSPDRQQIFEDLQKQFPDKPAGELLKRAQEAPQTMIDQAMKSRPSADTAGNPGSGTDFMQDSGAANVASATTTSDVLNDAAPPGADARTMQTIATGKTQLNDSGAAAVAQGAPQQPAQPTQPMQPDASSVADSYMSQPPGADNGVPQPPGAGAPGPDGQPMQTSDDQQSQDAQFDQVRQKLDQSPEGQGVHTTLDRLASVTNSVQADKLRRQAQLQLGDIDPEVDPSEYMDWYLQQQQQQPDYA